MNILRRQKKYLELAQYLCTPIGKKENNKFLYPTFEQAAQKFDYSPTHIAKIKAKLCGNDVDGIRRIKDEVLSGMQ